MPDDPKVHSVAMVLGSGGLGKGGYYNQMGMQGLQQAQKDFGIHFDYELPQSDADYERLLRAYAAEGRYGLVMVMSFGASAALERVAGEYPHQSFAAFDAHAECPNVANYGSEPRGISFLAGAAAAWLSKTGKVAALFGQESAGYWQWVASFIAGARYARPDAEVLWEFLSDWSPSVAEGEAAAHKLYQRGVDIIMAHLDTGDRGVFEAARAHAAYALGFNGERQLDPVHVLFDVTRHLEVSVHHAVQQLVDRTFAAGSVYWGLERGQYALDFGGAAHELITPWITARIEKLKEELMPGSPEEIKHLLNTHPA
ncbi:MAG: BMP family protein [Methyloligellaceae bacterium]